MDSEYVEFDVDRLLPLFDKSSKLKVDYDPEKFARSKVKEDLVPGFEEQIDVIWREKTKGNDRIYNGSKFRDLLGTHYAPNRDELTKQALEKGEADQYSFMSNAIGVGAITETSDGFVALVRRAGWTGEHAGFLDRPGGHPEPELIKKEMTESHPTINISDDYQGLDSNLVLRDILESPQHELRDEANIPLEKQKHLGLLGIIRDESHGGRVGFDSHVYTELTKKEIEDRYATGTHCEADESTALLFIPISDIKSWNLDAEKIKQMTPHCRGGLRLLHMKLIN